MRRGRASFLAATIMVALTASCRAIFGIDDFAGGPADGGPDAVGADGASDATNGDASVNGDASTDGATEGAIDGNLDSSIPLVATDACAGCFVVGELDLKQFANVFLGISADTVCWNDNVATIYCRGRSGGPTAQYVFDGGAFTSLNFLAVGDKALAVLDSNDVVGLTFDGGRFRSHSVSGVTGLNGIGALPGDQAVVAVGSPTGSEEGGTAIVVPMATPDLGGDNLMLTTSAGDLGPVPGQLAFYAASFGATTLTGVQLCKKAGVWQCDPQLHTTNNPDGVVAAQDGSVGLSLNGMLLYGMTLISDPMAISTPHGLALSKGQLVFARDDGDGGAQLAAWTPGETSIDLLVPSLGNKSIFESFAGDDDALFFVLYSGTHATIIKMKR
jgi:hypothetical protein